MEFKPDLFVKVLNQDLNNLDNFDEITSFRIDTLKENIFKKWRPKDTVSLESVAVENFFHCNELCRRFKLSNDDAQVEIRNIARTMLYFAFHTGPFQTCNFSLEHCLGEGLAGPGASVGVPDTSFYFKMFAGPLTSSSIRLYMNYKNGISSNWRDAELIRSRRHGVDIINTNKLTTVPKNRKTNRAICTEPSLNMFYQKGAANLLKTALKTLHNIDMSVQPEINKAMARIGSIKQNYATIDLQSASDTLSVALVRDLLPSSVFSTLSELRSENITYRDRVEKLHMFSSQGNGFNSALQTLIFATLVKATYIYLGVQPKTRSMHSRNYSCFGDDIIVTKSCYDEVVITLEASGFIVNKEKSYNDGFFRESCGGDFYKGYNVRSVYFKEINNAQQVYTAFNVLFRWSVSFGINVPRSLAYLKSLVEFRPIPFDESDDGGIKVPLRYATEARGVKGCPGSYYYRTWVTRNSKRTVRIDSFAHNPSGVIISNIGGYMHGTQVGTRLNVPSYKVARRRTPRWDYIPCPGFTILECELAFLELEKYGTLDFND